MLPALRRLLVKRPRWWVAFYARYLLWLYQNIYSKQIFSGLDVVTNRKAELVVTFTSYTPRYPLLHICIQSLLKQSLKPNRILLYVAKEDHGKLPESILQLQKRGLDIRYVADLKSHKKYFFARQEFPQAFLITADDDLFYPRHWLKQLWESYNRNPNCIHCHRAHLLRMDSQGNWLPYRQWDYESQGISGPSLDLFPTGNGGVLYPPGFLPEGVLQLDDMMAYAPKADDVWLRLWTRKMGISVCKVKPYYTRFVEIPSSQTVSLNQTNYAEDANDPQIKAVRKCLDGE